MFMAFVTNIIAVFPAVPSEMSQGAEFDKVGQLGDWIQNSQDMEDLLEKARHNLTHENFLYLRLKAIETHTLNSQLPKFVQKSRGSFTLELNSHIVPVEYLGGRLLRINQKKVDLGTYPSNEERWQAILNALPSFGNTSVFNVVVPKAEAFAAIGAILAQMIEVFDNVTQRDPCDDLVDAEVECQKIADAFLPQYYSNTSTDRGDDDKKSPPEKKDKKKDKDKNREKTAPAKFSDSKPKKDPNLRCPEEALETISAIRAVFGHLGDGRTDVGLVRFQPAKATCPTRLTDALKCEDALKCRITACFGDVVPSENTGYMPNNAECAPYLNRMYSIRQQKGPLNLAPDGQTSPWQKNDRPLKSPKVVN